jgi:hypothetical protein
MEYDSDRAGGFAPLRFVPKGKMVVLGLVTSKSGALESKDELKRRIDQAARYIDLDQLCLSPQCGFASTEEGISWPRTSSGRSCGRSWRSPTRSGDDGIGRRGVVPATAGTHGGCLTSWLLEHGCPLSRA